MNVGLKSGSKKKMSGPIAPSAVYVGFAVAIAMMLVESRPGFENTGAAVGFESSKGIAFLATFMWIYQPGTIVLHQRAENAHCQNEYDDYRRAKG
jgi:uncharacterized membrane protein YhhN